MKVVYEPATSYTEEPPVPGMVNFISWDNPDLHAAFNKLFAVVSWERVARVEITREGIRAVIQPVPGAKSPPTREVLE